LLLSGRICFAFIQTHDDRLSTSIKKEVSDGITHRTAEVQTAKGALVITKIGHRDGLIDGTAGSTAQESCNRSGNTDDGTNSAGKFLDIHTRIR
jgi:hypothetical protein